MSRSFIRLDVRERIAVVTIDRPPVNALNSQAYVELGEVFDELATLDIAAVVLTGAGEKAFVAGADVKEFLEFNSESGRLYTRRNNAVREKVRTFEKPVICAINGLALGGGCVLALMCDIRIASNTAKFSLAEINMGIIGGTQYISRVIPPGAARMLTYTGEMISAAEALRLGMIEEVLPPDQVREQALSIARKIAEKPPIAIRYAKMSLNEALNLDLTEGMKYEEALNALMWGTEDKNEAVKAFLEKRRPEFKGR